MPAWMNASCFARVLGVGAGATDDRISDPKSMSVILALLIGFQPYNRGKHSYHKLFYKHKIQTLGIHEYQTHKHNCPLGIPASTLNQTFSVLRRRNRPQLPTADVQNPISRAASAPATIQLAFLQRHKLSLCISLVRHKWTHP
jgi:hypothetical protein